MIPRLIVLAKAPVPGRVKTRLCPPCTPAEAAAIAEAALLDTLDAVRRAGGSRPLLALDGQAPRPAGFDVVAQTAGGLDQRIAAAFEAAGGPAVLIGMDTPHASPSLLHAAVQALGQPGIDAVLGRAEDGGWWACGLARPDRRVFEGVAMSTAQTGALQHARLHALGLRHAMLPRLRDVDTWSDARAVASAAAASRFAAAVMRASEAIRAQREDVEATWAAV